MHALTNALKIINAFFANIVPIGDILWTFPQNFSWYANIPIIGSIPFAIYLLLGMGIYFSIRTKFVQFRYFKRGIQVLTKKKKDTTGVSPLAAFMLSAAMRVGPGNIMILSILVDTFISKISLTMQPGPKIDSISGA